MMLWPKRHDSFVIINLLPSKISLTFIVSATNTSMLVRSCTRQLPPYHQAPFLILAHDPSILSLSRSQVENAELLEAERMLATLPRNFPTWRTYPEEGPNTLKSSYSANSGWFLSSKYSRNSNLTICLPLNVIACMSLLPIQKSEPGLPKPFS